MRLAFQNHSDAPSETTRRNLEEAKRLDRKDLIVEEAFLLGIFSVILMLFIQAKKLKSIHPEEN